MRLPTALTAALLLLVAFAPLLEAQGPGTGGGTGGGGVRPSEGPRGGERERALADEERAAWSNMSEDAREAALERAAIARLFGKLEFDGEDARGRFLSFGYDAGSVSNVSIRNGNTSTSYFSANVSGFGAGAEPHVAGSVLRALGNDSFFAAHDNPTGLITYRARNDTLAIELALAPGVNATVDGERSITLRAPDGMHGHIVLNGNARHAVDASDNATLEITVGPHGRMLFMHHPVASIHGATLHALRDAAAEDRVGGIVSIVSDEHRPVEERVFFGVTMRTTHAADGRAEVVVSSENPAPRAVVLNVAGDVLGSQADSRVNVTIDGNTIPAAASAAAAFNASAAAYHAETSPLGVQVIVLVPGFSEHTIAVSLDEEAPTGATSTPAPATGTTAAGATPTATGTVGENGAPGAPLALVLVGLAVLAFARRRR